MMGLFAWKWVEIIVTLHPGQDGIVRTVTVKCDGKELKRATEKVSVLPFKGSYIHMKHDPPNDKVCVKLII
jgi:hypothetical protein